MNSYAATDSMCKVQHVCTTCRHTLTWDCISVRNHKLTQTSSDIWWCEIGLGTIPALRLSSSHPKYLTFPRAAHTVWSDLLLLSGGSYSLHKAWRGPTVPSSDARYHLLFSKFLHGPVGARLQPNSFFYVFHSRKADWLWLHFAAIVKGALITCLVRCCFNNPPRNCLESIEKLLQCVRKENTFPYITF